MSYVVSIWIKESPNQEASVFGSATLVGPRTIRTTLPLGNTILVALQCQTEYPTYFARIQHITDETLNKYILIVDVKLFNVKSFGLPEQYKDLVSLTVSYQVLIYFYTKRQIRIC